MDPLSAAQEIREMFSDIAPTYDRLNHLLSLSVDRLWRRRVAKQVAELIGPSGPGRPRRVLDVCAGTGDLALACARWIGPAGRVVALDFSRPMLLEARRKTGQSNGESPPASPMPGGGRIAAIEGDALCLPFADGSFDAATIAFGLRNLTDKTAGLREMTRVARAGGSVLVLEFSRPCAWWMAPFYYPYLRLALPLVGNVLTRSRAYAYLSETVRDFARPEEVRRWMRLAGLEAVQSELLTGGIAALHWGEVRMKG